MGSRRTERVPIEEVRTLEPAGGSLVGLAEGVRTRELVGGRLELELVGGTLEPELAGGRLEPGPELVGGRLEPELAGTLELVESSLEVRRLLWRNGKSQ